MRKLFVIPIFIVLLSGCWNYNDVNNMRFMTSLAIDYDEQENEFIATAEVISYAEDEPVGDLFQARGKTLFEAMRDLIMKNGRKIYVAHTKIVIVSEYIAKHKMISVIDYLERDAEYREDILLLVSAENTAEEILTSHTHTTEHKEESGEESESQEAYIHGVNGIYISDALQNEFYISKYHKVELWEFTKALYAEGISPTLPIIFNQYNFVHTIPRIFEQAVFDKDKLVGKLDETETQNYLAIIDELDGGIIVTKSKLSKKIIIVSLELFGSKTRIKPVLKDEKIIMNIDVEYEFAIAEIGGTENFIEKTGREQLKKDTEKLLKSQIENTIYRVQKEYEVDIFNFGSEIKKNMPNEWNKMKSNWGYYFSNLKYEVNVSVKLVGSQINSLPITVTN